MTIRKGKIDYVDPVYEFSEIDKITRDIYTQVEKD